jgi:hypothetical protein
MGLSGSFEPGLLTPTVRWGRTYPPPAQPVAARESGAADHELQEAAASAYMGLQMRGSRPAKTTLICLQEIGAIQSPRRSTSCVGVVAC